MAGITRLIRWLVGAGMVVGGGTLMAPVAQPLSHAVLAELRSRGILAPVAPHLGGPHLGQPPSAPLPAHPPTGLAPVPPLGGLDPQSVPAAALPVDSLTALPSTAVVSAEPVRQDYVPPPAPTPLPPPAGEFGLSAPQVDHAYRSTLDVPPPPLLDAHRPPPAAVAWNSGVGPAAAAPQPALASALVPATYRVQDGDDLTGIAARFYGHPAAATAIWEANRDVIADPNLLPIHAELRLPPHWSTLDVGAAGRRSIEPMAGPAAGSGGTAAAVVTASWLGGTTATTSAANPATTPKRVQVAAGETLRSLALRFYGDPAMADRIWEANRGRLRSPELLVPGMELTLP